MNDANGAARVAVIIPTTGRASLKDAVRSAVEQNGVAVEVVVVCDTKTIPPVVDSLVDDVHRVICTGGGRGGSFARNIGVANSRAPYVAFLDDDDEWLPDKLDHQLRVAEEMEAGGHVPVMASQILQRRPGQDPISVPTPRRVIAEGQKPEDYLFKGRSITLQRPTIATSTILTLRELAQEVRWNESLRRHQDWDWLVRASRRPRVVIRQLDEATALFTVGSARSMSASCDWAASLAWARTSRRGWDGQTYVDFLASQALRYALQARSVIGVVQIVVEIGRRGRVPRFCSLASATLGIVPRRWLERILTTRTAVVPGATEPDEPTAEISDPVVFIPAQRTGSREYVRG
jgi:glycosyltransferase involved in cell wall biosynthesis